MTNTNRSGIWLVLLGCLPFALGRLSYSVEIDSLSGPGDQCVARAVAGIPCPLCGGSRAFSLFLSGNASFLNYNFFWVLLALALIGTGFLAMMGRLSLTRLWTQTGNLPVYLMLVALAGGWLTALLNRSSIMS